MYDSSKKINIFRFTKIIGTNLLITWSYMINVSHQTWYVNPEFNEEYLISDQCFIFLDAS